MNKTYLGILDSRNTKYQGCISNQTYQGIGMLIDSKFMTIVTNWNDNKPNGHSFIIYPSLQIFFGEIKDEKPCGICCYQISNSQKLIFHHNLKQKSTTIAHIIQSYSITHLILSQTKCSIINAYNIKLESKLLQLLSKIFSQPVDKSHIDIKQYLRHNIVKDGQQFQLQVKQGKHQAFFGYKDTNSLGIKIQAGLPIAIGNFTSFPRTLIYGRKINKNAYPRIQIQQGLFQQPHKTYTFYVDQLSIDAQKLTEQYFKKSTTFRNQFTRLDNFDRFHSDLKGLQKNVNECSKGQFGQVILQNGNHQAQQQIAIKQFTLSQVKQQIYKAASRKQNSNRLVESRPQFLQFQVSNKKHVQSCFLEPTSSRDLISERYNYLGDQINFDLSPTLAFDHHFVNSIDGYRDRSRLQNTSAVNRKNQLIKQVHQKIRIQKQLEQALIKQLIKQDKIKENIIIQTSTKHHNQQYNQSYKRYKRYQISTASPFTHTISPDKSLHKNFKRTYKYSQSDHKKQNKSPFTYQSPYQRVIQPYVQKLMQPIHPQVSNFQVKNYQNLLKYQQRKKRSQKSTQKLKQQRQNLSMQEIKLFQVNKQRNQYLKNQQRKNHIQVHSPRNNTQNAQPRCFRRQNTDNKSCIKSKRSFNYLD